MKVGNVISNKSGLHVITQITDGVVSETEFLDSYVSKVAMVMLDGEFKTIKEALQIYRDMYLSQHEIIEE